MLGVIPGNLPGTYRPMGTCRQVTKNQLQTDKHTKRITNLESFLSNSSSSFTIILTREGELVNEAVVSAPLSHLSSHSPNVSLCFPGHCPPFPLTLSHYFYRTTTVNYPALDHKIVCRSSNLRKRARQPLILPSASHVLGFRYSELSHRPTDAPHPQFWSHPVSRIDFWYNRIPVHRR